MTLRKVAVISLALLSACAQQPDKVAAVHQSEAEFAGKSCAQLAADRVTLEQNVANISAVQRSAADGDALGVFLLGVPTSSMSGGDKATDLAVAKGRLQALDRARAAKNCK
jgi:hypothetical protein